MTTAAIHLILPYPPSVNTYWGFHGHRRFLTKQAVKFKQLVANTFLSSGQQGLGDARLSIIIRLSPPDRRKRDIDNVIKGLLDALCQAGIFVDDEQFDEVHIHRASIKKGGECEICIAKL